jgi:hypothetical protein
LTWLVGWVSYAPLLTPGHLPDIGTSDFLVGEMRDGRFWLLPSARTVFPQGAG